MTKTTFDSIMAGRWGQRKVESTLYMPSMYDTGDEDDGGVDQRDERSFNERGRQVPPPSPRFALQRCLAWSQDEDLCEGRDEQDEEETEDDDESESQDLWFPVTEHPDNHLSILKSYGSFHSAVIDATNSSDYSQNISASSDSINKNNNTTIRPIHWEEQVNMEKDLLDSFLSIKKVMAAVVGGKS